MKNYSFEKLEPRGVLTWFKKVCSVPHGTHNEMKLSNMLMEALNKAGCWVKQYSSGAILAKKPATKGYENKPLVALQAHMDMVLVKEPKVKIDFLKEPIKPYYDSKDKCIKCDGTTLGADNGVGVAVIMEIMTNSKYQHGPLEALLTVCEESDIGYCMESLPKGVLKAKHLFNLDNDIPDKMYIASNGTMKVTFEKKLEYLPINNNTSTYQVLATGFDGGHSALMVHNPLNNAIAFLCEGLYSFCQEHNKIRLFSINGGMAMNAIADEAEAIIQIDPKDVSELKNHLQKALENAQVLAQGLDKGAKIIVRPAKKSTQVACSIDETEKILFFYAFLPNGIYCMDITMKHIFAASNIGVVKTTDGVMYSIVLPRSFNMPDLDRRFRIFQYFGKLAGMTNFQKSVTCPPWLTNKPENSPTIQAWIKAYHKVTGKYSFPVKDPGGLEPSELIIKCPQLQNHSVTVGPRIIEEHTTRERVEVPTIEDFFKSVLTVLKEIK